MKKRWITLMLALVMLLSAGCAALATETGGRPLAADSKPQEDGNAADGGFIDVPENSFYFDAVNWAVEEGITNGLTESSFGPNAECNRAQVVTFLWRLDGMPDVSGENAFTDVEEGSWYADAVKWAVERKVTNGMGEGIFQPNGTCNRAQIVTFLWKYAGQPQSDGTNPFTDVPENDWYAEAVVWAVENGITTGLTADTFGPQEPCNRAQIVTFLYRYVQSLTDAPEETLPTEPEPTETQPTEPEPTETQPTEPEPTDDPNMGEWA